MYAFIAVYPIILSQKKGVSKISCMIVFWSQTEVKGMNF